MGSKEQRHQTGWCVGTALRRLCVWSVLCAFVVGCGPALSDRARALGRAGKHKEAIDLLKSVPDGDLNTAARAQLLMACGEFLRGAMRTYRDPAMATKPFQRKQILLDTHKCPGNARHTRKLLDELEPQIQATEMELRGVLDLLDKKLLHKARGAMDNVSPSTLDNPGYAGVKEMVHKKGYEHYLGDGLALLRKKRLRKAAKSLNMALDWLEGKEALAGLKLIDGAKLSRRKAERRRAFDLLVAGLEVLPDVEWAAQTRDKLRRSVVMESLQLARSMAGQARFELLGQANRAALKSVKDAAGSSMAEEAGTVLAEVKGRIGSMLLALLVRDCAHDPVLMPGYCHWLVTQARCAGVISAEVEQLSQVATRGLEARAKPKVTVRMFDHAGLGGQLAGGLEAAVAQLVQSKLPPGIQYTQRLYEANILILVRLRRYAVRHTVRQAARQGRYIARVEKVVNPAWQQLEARRQVWARACPGIYDICRRAPAYCNHTAKRACDTDAVTLRNGLARTPQTLQRTIHSPYPFVAQNEAYDADVQLELVTYDASSGVVLSETRGKARRNAKAQCQRGVRADDADGNKGSPCQLPPGDGLARAAFDEALAVALKGGLGLHAPTKERFLALARKADQSRDMLGAIGWAMSFLHGCGTCEEGAAMKKKLLQRSYPGLACEHLTGSVPPGAAHLDAALALEPKQPRRTQHPALDRNAVITSEFQLAVRARSVHGDVVHRDWMLAGRIAPPVAPSIPVATGQPIRPQQDAFGQCINACTIRYNACAGACGGQVAVNLDGVRGGQCYGACIEPLSQCYQICSAQAPPPGTAPPPGP